MIKTIVKNIEIQYDESQNSKIDNIKKIINNNSSLLSIILGSCTTLSLIPVDNEKIIYVEDFEEFFKNTVYEVFNHENNKYAFNNPDLLPGLYIEYLARNAASDRTISVAFNSNVDDEMFYSIVAYKYFEKNGCFNDFVEYLKYRKNNEKILKWLGNESRFQAYNYLLKEITSFLKENDLVFSQNINEIVNKMLVQTIAVLGKKDDNNENTSDLPTISPIELDSLFCEFLESINAPYHWKQMYKDLKNNNRISFKKQNDNINETSKCYEDSNGDLRILIISDDIFDSFCAFVHEFSHYVVMKNNKLEMSQFLLWEFPSIFFERLELNF